MMVWSSHLVFGLWSLVFGLMGSCLAIEQIKDPRPKSSSQKLKLKLS